MAEPEPPAEAIGAVEPEPELPGASSLSPPHDGGEEPDLRHLRQSSSGSGGGARRNDASGYRPPLWSMSFGDPHGQWLTRDDASRDKLRCVSLEREHLPPAWRHGCGSCASGVGSAAGR
jgi:hypothetical protein